MTHIAGIINLNHTPRVTAPKLREMLLAMDPQAEPFDLPSRTRADWALAGRSNGSGPASPYHTEQAAIGRAPIVQDRDCEILMAGELYNDAVLRGCSPESYLLAQYRELGAQNFAKQLNGSFCAVIIDQTAKTVLLVTDHMNSHPLYFAVVKDQLFFASQIKAFLALDILPREPNTKALFSLCTSGCILGSDTICRSVKQLDYATVCTIAGSEIDHLSYWRFSIHPEPDRGKGHYLDAMTDHLKTAVKRQSCSPDTMGVMLSGGYDSRGILAAMGDVKQIQAISFSPRRSTRPLGDASVAAKIAAFLEMDFSFMPYDASGFEKAMHESVTFSDGAAGFVFENIWQDISRKTKVRTLIFGDTTMLGSKGRLTGHRDIPYLIELPLMNQMAWLSPFIAPSFSDEFAIHAKTRFHSLIQGAKQKQRWDSFYELYYENRLIHFLLPRRQVIKGHGLRVRNPLLDLDLINFVRRLPLRYRKEKSLFKQGVLTMNPALMDIPLAEKNEGINYHPFLARAEQESAAISTLFFTDNPLFSQYFNEKAVKTLVKKATRPSPGSFIPKPSYHLRKMIPGPLKNMIRPFWHPAPPCREVDLLLNLMTVAMTLKHLHNFTPQRDFTEIQRPDPQ